MKSPEGVSRDDPQIETARLSPAASLFHSLSDPTRLAILRHLSLGEHRVVELTAHLGLAQLTVSKHPACLRDCGLIDSRPVGGRAAASTSLETRHETTADGPCPAPLVGWRSVIDAATAARRRGHLRPGRALSVP
ncbi:ArsR/SmtB family transcription factor [Blastococcus sp. SYSU DS0539]